MADITDIIKLLDAKLLGLDAETALSFLDDLITELQLRRDEMEEELEELAKDDE